MTNYEAMIEKQKIKDFQELELPALIQRTSSFIEPDELEDWKKVCATNSNTMLNIQIFRMIADMLASIGEGKTFDEMDEEVCNKKYNSSIHSKQVAVEAISDYAVCGDAIRMWWDSKQEISNEVKKPMNSNSSSKK